MLFRSSTPGEEVVLFNQVPDGNSGQELPANPLFGELVVGTPILVPTPALKVAEPRVEALVHVATAPPAQWDAAQD